MGGCAVLGWPLDGLHVLLLLLLLLCTLLLLRCCRICVCTCTTDLKSQNGAPQETSRCIH